MGTDAPLDSGFPPVADARARVLVLGSMPGQASLRAAQYYAHPRNAFWPIMAELLGFDPGDRYEVRTDHLRQRGVALWDVIAQCRRPGSLDAHIQNDSVAVNDFAGLFRRCPGIRVIAFNGRTAESLFRRHVLTQDPGLSRLRCLALPSTSPAHAARSIAQKRAAWSVLRDALPAVGSTAEQA